MKNFYILFLILLVSCNQKMIITQPKTLISKRLKLDLSEKKYFLGIRDCCSDENMIFEFKDENDSLKGKLTNIRFIEDGSTFVKGTIKDSIIDFTYKKFGRRDSTAYGIIGKNEIKLKLNGYNNLTLTEIDSNTYYQKYLEVYPKLINLEKDTILGDYLFEIRIKNWNSRTLYGETTITIKNKISREEIQQIKSDEFYYNNKNNLYSGYDADYNFDGYIDLRYSTGNQGPYASYSASYYIYDKSERKFIRNIEYENIANSLAFEVDTINKRMISHNRGSSNIHYTDAYKWKNNKIELVKSLIVDGQSRNRVILKERFNGELKTIINEPYRIFTDKEIKEIYDNF